MAIFGLKYFLLDQTEYSDTYDNSNGIVKDIGGKVPNASI